ncbi:hypothetical protein D3C72_990880 [compost metagenome]
MNKFLPLAFMAFSLSCQNGNTQSQKRTYTEAELQQAIQKAKEEQKTLDDATAAVESATRATTEINPTKYSFGFTITADGRTLKDKSKQVCKTDLYFDLEHSEPNEIGRIDMTYSCENNQGQLKYRILKMNKTLPKTSFVLMDDNGNLYDAEIDYTESDPNNQRFFLQSRNNKEELLVFSNSFQINP